MKTRSSLFCIAAALVLMARFSPVAAQYYNPPPPPEQQNTGGDSSMGQGTPPPGQGEPMQGDQGAPPPPGADMQDQGGPQGAPGPDDNGAPPDAGNPDASAGGDANFQTFYNDLNSQGNWVQTDNYGYAWQPNVDDPNWSPYSNGHWVYTDEGWTWVADASEPWGWATYHYGRWVNVDGYGWMWVPGYTWAPAWVSWRYGGGYCGWAPLPPDTFVGIDFGGVDVDFHIGGDCDTAYGIGPGYYNFIPVGYIGARDYRHYYHNRNDNFALIGNTRNVTNILVNHRRGSGRFGRVSVGGPDIATVNAQSRTPVARMQLARGNSVSNGRANGHQLSVFAPHVRAAAGGTTFRPSRVAGTISHAQVNNGTNIESPLAVNSRVRSPAASSAQVAAARADAGRAGSAHFATTGTRPTRGLSQPLSSFQPRTEARSAATGTSAQHNRTVTPAATTQRTAESAFTGGNTGSHEVRHAATTGAGGTPAYHREASAPPQPQATERRAASQAPVHHEEAPPQARHEESRPAPQHTEEHHAVEHHESAPQHAAAPQRTAAPQHAAPRPAAARPSGGGGGHPSGGGGGHPSGSKDNSDHH